METKTIKTSTSGMDIVGVTQLVEKHYSYDSDEKTIALLYGDYTYHKDGEAFAGMFENVHIFKGYAKNNAYNYIVEYHKGDAQKFLSMDKDLNLSNFQEGTIIDNSFDNLADSLYNVDYFAILKKDGMYIEDKNLFLPFHLKGLRRFQNCPNCKQYYRTYCKCTDKAQIRSHNMSSVYFNDVINGKLITSNRSLNKTLSQRRAFIGFEWELGFEKARRSQAEQTLGFYRMLKSKDIALLNLFGEAMSDSTIGEHYGKGAEIGSNVFSLDYYLKYQSEIERVTEWANENEMYGSKLGFHIHISRDAFDQKSLVKWLSFMTTSNQVLLKLSGRGMSSGIQKAYAKLVLPYEYQDENISNLHGAGITTHSKLKKLATAVLGGHSLGDKFNYLNFVRTSTIEYRLPASSTDDGKGAFNRVCRHLELMFATFEFATYEDLEDMRFDKFLEWLSKTEYINLYNAITSDDETMKLIEPSAKLSKAQTLIPPKTEIDVTNAEEVAKMSEAFKDFEKSALSLQEEDEFTKEVITKHAGKLKPRITKKEGV